MTHQRSFLVFVGTVIVAIFIGVAVPVVTAVCPAILIVLVVVTVLLSLVNEAGAVWWAIFALLVVLIAFGLTMLVAVASVVGASRRGDY